MGTGHTHPRLPPPRPCAGPPRGRSAEPTWGGKEREEASGAAAAIALTWSNFPGEAVGGGGGGRRWSPCPASPGPVPPAGGAWDALKPVPSTRGVGTPPPPPRPGPAHGAKPGHGLCCRGNTETLAEGQPLTRCPSVRLSACLYRAGGGPAPPCREHRSLPGHRSIAPGCCRRSPGSGASRPPGPAPLESEFFSYIFFFRPFPPPISPPPPFFSFPFPAPFSAPPPV